MADATYPSDRPYHKQDGSFVIPSGSTMDVESGGYINVNSGGTLTNAGTLANSGTQNNTGTFNNNGTFASSGTFTLESGGTNTINASVTLTNKGIIANSSNGQIRERVVLASTAQALKVNGLSVIGSTAAGALNYTLAAPGAAGIRKTIWCKNSTGACTVTVSTGATVNLTTTRKLTWTATGDLQGVELVSSTTANWCVLFRSTLIKCT